MNFKHLTTRPKVALSLVAVALSVSTQLGVAQGTINFNEPWIGDPGEGYALADYYEGILWLRVVNSYNRPPQSRMMRWKGSAGGPTVYNGTPYMFFIRYGTFDDHVLLSTTNASLFGLSSVDLADLRNPSPAPISITFEGYRPGYYNPFVSVTFTTSGGGTSSFETFYFPADFASGLAWVAIRSTGWAMDNLVWIPEPSALALLIAVSAGLLLRRFRRQTPNR